MKRSHFLLFFLKVFATGLLSPVLALIFLAHGADMQTLSLCIGVYSVLVVLFEVPSGIFADSFGRKRIFLFSVLFTAAAYLFFLKSSSLPLLLFGCALYGIGTAFASGSVEALEIEAALHENGAAALPRVNSCLALSESAGLSAGPVAGGIIGFADPQYRRCRMRSAQA